MCHFEAPLIAHDSPTMSATVAQRPNFSKLPLPCANCTCETTGCPKKASLSPPPTAQSGHPAGQETQSNNASSDKWERDLEKEIISTWEWQAW